MSEKDMRATVLGELRDCIEADFIAPDKRMIMNAVAIIDRLTKELEEAREDKAILTEQIEEANDLLVASINEHGVLKEATRWRNVSEETPVGRNQWNSKWWLVKRKGVIPHRALFHYGQWKDEHGVIYRDVILWMPLPSPPEDK